MDKEIESAKKDEDIVLLMIDGSKKITENDYQFVESFKDTKQNVIIVVNKIDDTTFEKLYPQLVRFNDMKFVLDIIPISALTGKNVDELLKVIKSNLTGEIQYFEDDIYTDKSIRFIVGEYIREKALKYLQEEIPHGIAVEIVEFKQEEKKTIIDADIICEKDSHKPIILGNKGEMIKRIGTEARLDIEKFLNTKVYLSLFVKVRQNWRNNSTKITNFGYTEE